MRASRHPHLLCRPAQGHAHARHTCVCPLLPLLSTCAPGGQHTTSKSRDRHHTTILLQRRVLPRGAVRKTPGHQGQKEHKRGNRCANTLNREHTRHQPSPSLFLSLFLSLSLSLCVLSLSQKEQGGASLVRRVSSGGKNATGSRRQRLDALAALLGGVLAHAHALGGHLCAEARGARWGISHGSVCVCWPGRRVTHPPPSPRPARRR